MSVMYGPVFAEHLLVSLVPWIAGVVVGSCLGYACALMTRSLFSTRRDLRRASMLLPWRTVAVTLPLLSPFVPVVLGLGRVTGAAIVGLFVFLFALPFTVVTLLEHWYTSPLVVRLIAGTRTLATASIAVATATPWVAGSGAAGVLILEGWRLLDYAQVIRGFSIVVLLALIIDLLLGTLQLLSFYTSREVQPAQDASG